MQLRRRVGKGVDLLRREQEVRDAREPEQVALPTAVERHAVGGSRSAPDALEGEPEAEGGGRGRRAVEADQA